MKDIHEVYEAIGDSIFDHMFTGWDYSSRGEIYRGRVFYGRQMGHTTKAIEIMNNTTGTDFFYITSYEKKLTGNFTHIHSGVDGFKDGRGFRGLQVNNSFACIILDEVECSEEDAKIMYHTLKLVGYDLISLVHTGMRF